MTDSSPNILKTTLNVNALNTLRNMNLNKEELVLLMLDKIDLRARKLPETERDII